MRTHRLAVLICALALLASCSPKYNWREAHGDKLQFTVLLPAKPASFSRQIDLNGTPVTMTMTAAEIDGVTFAVGAAELSDAAQTPKALESMRTALVNNIGGAVQEAKLPGQALNGDHALDLSATGMVQGRPMRLMARLIARDKRIFQVLIMGGAQEVAPEHVDTFFTSFKPA